MGKYKTKKQRSVGLEIVAKEQNEEPVKLPESRKSDDKPLKKVNLKKQRNIRIAFMSASRFRKNGLTGNEFWYSVGVESTSVTAI